MNSEKLISRVLELTRMGDEVLKTEHKIGQFIRVDLILFYEFRASSMSFILNLFGDKHPCYADFSDKVGEASPSTTKRGIGILRAIKGEIEQGWLISTRSLISADIFADLIEMSDHLLIEGYKDPAAVLAGSALEQHLKTLCNAYNIETTIERNDKLFPKKADVINAELYKSNVYSKLDQKNITYLLGIRNNAAHGEFAQYNSDQVRFMLASVSEFIGRTAI